MQVYLSHFFFFISLVFDWSLLTPLFYLKHRRAISRWENKMPAEKKPAEKKTVSKVEKKVEKAKQLLPKLSPEARKIAEARIALIRNAKVAKAKYNSSKETEPIMPNSPSPVQQVRTKSPSTEIIENSDVLVACKYCVAFLG